MTEFERQVAEALEAWMNAKSGRGGYAGRLWSREDPHLTCAIADLAPRVAAAIEAAGYNISETRGVEEVALEALRGLGREGGTA